MRFQPLFPLLALLLLPISLSGQTAPAIPPVISAFTGSAVLERETGVEATSVDMALVSGDRLRTGSGWVELLFRDGTRVYADDRTTLDLMDDALLRLTAGRLVVIVPGATASLPLRIDTPNASVETRGAGEYRIGVEGASTNVSVLRGVADVAADRRAVQVGAGQHVSAYRGDVTTPARFNVASSDALQRWIDERRPYHVAGSSAQYLPADLVPYAPTFDRHGTWTSIAQYGTVWLPNVAAGWRPYWNGRWATMPVYGATWVGADPWSWPTHHFGRWTFDRGRWAWIPRAGWRGAWVHWASAPGFVSWSPIGPGNFPITQIPSPGGVDLYGAGAAYDPWFGWTVMPRGAFDRSRDVPAHLVRPEWLSREVRDRFVARSTLSNAASTPGSVRGSPVRNSGVPRPDRTAETIRIYGVPRPQAPQAPASWNHGLTMPGGVPIAPRQGFGQQRAISPATTGAGLPPLPGPSIRAPSGIHVPLRPSMNVPTASHPFGAPAPLRGPVLGGFPAGTGFPPITTAAPPVTVAAPAGPR